MFLPRDRCGSFRSGATAPRNGSFRSAYDEIVEHGFDAPISESAHRAGVGVASTYRRFPTEEQLALRVRLESTRRIAENAEAAASSGAPPWDALVSFLHACTAEGIGTVLPAPSRHQVWSAELDAAKERMAGAVEQLVDAARRSGELRADVTPAGIVPIFKHLNPPLPSDERRRAHLRARYLELVISGLRAGAGSDLPGPAPDWTEPCCTGATERHP